MRLSPLSAHPVVTPRAAFASPISTQAHGPPKRRRQSINQHLRCGLPRANCRQMASRRCDSWAKGRLGTMDSA